MSIRPRWKDVCHAKSLPREIPRVVVEVFRTSEGASIVHVARDLVIPESCVQQCLQTDDVESGRRPGKTASEAADARVMKKRIQLMQQENEVLRRAATCCARDVNPRIYPMVVDLAAEGIPVAGTCDVLGSPRRRSMPGGWTRSASGTGTTLTCSMPRTPCTQTTRSSGYRFIADQPEREHGIVAGEGRVNLL